jgi:sugar O-acyltransferase (sialic acid O-acetyltransferase NeuD family)
MDKLILIGGGGHCKSCIDVIEIENKFKILGVLDPALKGKEILGYKVLGDDSLIDEYILKGCYFLITLGQISTPKHRRRVYSVLKKKKAKLATVISPRSHVSKHSKIKEGVIIMHDALVNSGALVMENCIINTKSLVEHDSTICAQSHISTGAIVNGGCVIKEGSFIGSNAVITECVETNFEAFVKAGVCFSGR